MKLYYDTNTGEIVEAGTFDLQPFSRNSLGNISKHKNLEHLYLIGDVYTEPIMLPTSIELRKVIGDVSFHIQHGTVRNGKIEGGLRLHVQGRGFNYYSTNVVVSFERINKERVDFYTLSGSHYSLIYLIEN